MGASSAGISMTEAPAPRRWRTLPFGDPSRLANFAGVSFYDPELDEGCAFEELISFHGGIGGPQTRPFILHPIELPFPDSPVVGAKSVHALLLSWRQLLENGKVASPDAVAIAAE